MNKRKTAQPVTVAPAAVQADPEPLVYVGPSITGVVIRNTTYGELPRNFRAAIKERPWLRGLCVPIARLGEALRQIQTGNGSVFTLYVRALQDSAEIEKVKE